MIRSDAIGFWHGQAGLAVVSLRSCLIWTFAVTSYILAG